MKSARSENLIQSESLRKALVAHYAQIHLEYIDHNAEWGVCLRVPPGDGPRVLRVTAQVRDPQDKFWTEAPGGAHAVRAAARLACLRAVHLTRKDVEGIEDVDVDLSSSQIFKTYIKSL
eukprot:6269521-Pyramimonas_sp.AAC.1